MPKQTFFHLPKDKRDTLIQAAKKEFSRAPLHEASIANIIKDAGIPRGSFYQYFEEKDDLYYYLLNELSEKNNDRFIASLREKNGDIFEAFIDSYQCLIQNLKNQEDKNFFKHTFLNMNYRMKDILANNIYEENRKNQYLSMIGLINSDHLNVRNEQELHHILQIIMAITFQNLVHMFVRNLSDEETLIRYIEQIDLLKRGFNKENATR